MYMPSRTILTLDFERIELALDTSSAITFQTLDEAAQAYWNEWEQKATKAREMAPDKSLERTREG